MIKNLKEPLLKKWTALRFGKVSLFVFAVVAFLSGHFTMDSYMNTCRAQSLLQPPLPMVVPPTYGGTCFLAFGPPICNPVPCDPNTTSEDVVQTIWDAFHDTLVDYASNSPDYTATKRDGSTFTSGTGLEGFADGIVDAMLYALMDRLNDIELGYIDWFETMWFYNLKPALMDMTDQQNTSNSDQVRAFQGGQDTSDSNMVNVGHQEQQVKDARTFRLSENGACPGAAAAGGGQRAYNLSREVRKSVQKDTTIADGLNVRNTPAAKGRGARNEVRSAAYETLFCNPTDNGGDSQCRGTPVPGLANADTKPSATLYGSLTIPMHDTTALPGTPPPGITNRGEAYETAAKEMVTNMTGDPTADPIPPEAMVSAQGVEEFIDRRSHVARVAAIRSVPQLGVSWRTPGTRLGQMVTELRNEGGTPSNCAAGEATIQTAGPTQGAPCDISDNPSYREVMHAIAVDRFTTGRYANDMTTNESDIEMEKLTIESFYLMQLRDYYELLERMALTLAVQVAISADQVPVNVPQTARQR